MKKTLIMLLCLTFVNIQAQGFPEKKVKSVVNEVTVFLEGAQITRHKTVEVIKGKSVVKFVNLSPFIDAKSVQVKAAGNVTVLAVNHQQNFIEKLEKQKELVDLEAKLKEVEKKITLEKTHLQILKEEIAFLKENRKIGGNNGISVANLKDASTFFGTKLTALKVKEIERNTTVEKLNEQRNDLANQINTLTSKRDFPNGEILVKLEAKNSTNVKFELSYVVANAGWFPTYDIRVKNVNEPVELVYKANVKQDTKINWNNVKLKLSSANPNVSGITPELRTYLLNYNTRPPVYKRGSNEVKGVVKDGQGDPLPGATVIVEGTTIGTVTDFDGRYAITLPNNQSTLKFSFVGFQTKQQQVRGSVLNVVLHEEMNALEEVVVVGYGSSSDIEFSQRKRSGAVGSTSKMKVREARSNAVPMAQVENQTTVDFEIKTPYTIKSDNKSYAVDIESYQLSAFYQYYCVPKIEKDAFLIANISDWEKYNLLEGEANIFFEGTYVGKTILDVRYATDTLQISLGRDNNVSVNREKVKDFTSKKLIGSKKEETRHWTITVKNNKSEKINMLLFDQVPVSTLEEIKIEVPEISGAKYNVEKGELKWEFGITPSQTKKFQLKYVVKYPKNRNLLIE